MQENTEESDRHITIDDEKDDKTDDAKTRYNLDGS